MSIVEKILPYEKKIFLWLNDHHTDYWDAFMWLYSDRHTWWLLGLVTIFVFLFKNKWQEAILLIFCAILIGILCDSIPTNIIKPFFERFRPSHHPDFSHLVDIVNNYRGGPYGFISIHVANGFGIAVFASLLLRYKYFTLAIIGWVFITAYSRIYLGVHFVSDVVGGAIWG